MDPHLHYSRLCMIDMSSNQSGKSKTLVSKGNRHPKSANIIPSPGTKKREVDQKGGIKRDP